MPAFRLVLVLLTFVGFSHRALGVWSIARDWNEQNLSAIRIDRPNPPVHVRNLFSLSVCMYDAWAAYDPVAVGFLYRGKNTAVDVAAARREAISYAAYRILKERYVYSLHASNTLAALDAHMVALGYDTNNLSMDTSTPAGLGNSIYATVSAYFINDGSRQTSGYSDYPENEGGYVYINPPLVTGTNGISTVDVNRWQRLAIANAVDQNGFPIGPIQTYVGVQWLRVRPFSLSRTNSAMPWAEVPPVPKLNGIGDADFRDSVVWMIARSAELTPDDGVMIDISPGITNGSNYVPGTKGNNTLGANDGIGHVENPITHQPYAPHLVPRGDYVRCLAEFWADGPESETPPGHWNVIANDVSDYPGLTKRIMGTGPVVDDLEWDVKLYFSLNAALHDAACACWSIKRYYDGWRPISAVRYMCQKGQSTYNIFTNQTHYELTYHPDGVPIIPGLIEQVNSLTRSTGQRHEGLPLNSIAIKVWPGQPSDPTNDHSGIKWIRGDGWIPYQRVTFVTPAFPGYVSGHSTFSRAAAETLTLFTGSEYFPGGRASYVCPSNSFLKFEKGPSQTVEFQWATYFDAADQVGLSRIWGGIHPPIDDFTGRRVGSQVGLKAWALSHKYWDGSITNELMELTLRSLNPGNLELHCPTLRGFYYQLQSTPDLGLPFTDELVGATLAFDTVLVTTNPVVAGSKFFRVERRFGP